ncbi:alpha/beta hydrolase [Sphingobacterium sp. SGR-19]|uniref:alpha/beta hydrolase n=1 Tax=Sphingobacterium sp. SGR-19 TaxID=2710886 RepID=UPI0013EAEDC7|nr:dienelactone hydrolase family protein [Sphingobacterium sp. SGR-19]NGM64324.1 carboxylesterase family protein [Sphingobacterium sp. SGR-19]
MRRFIDKKRGGRKGHLIALLSLAILCCFSAATTAAGQPQTAGEDIQVHRNIRYGEKPKGIGQDTTSDRTLDLYLPENRAGKLPVFMFVHGGGFAGGDKGNAGTQAFCTKLAKHGFAVISINYYLTLKHEKTAGASCTANMSKGLPTKGFHPKLQEAVKNASNDAQLALQWIKDNTDVYRFDLSSVAISGGSAGAMTALYTAYASGQTILPIQAVVNLWGGLENSNHIKSGAPALLTYHGDQDKLIHVDYAYDLEKKMKEIGSDLSETHVFQGKGHAIYNYITAEKTEEIVGFLKSVLQLDNVKVQRIGTVQGLDVTEDEIQREMRKYRAEVFRLVVQKNGLKNSGSAFWQESQVDGVKAIDILRAKAISALTTIKVQEKMLVERNLWPYTSYPEFLADLRRNNESRRNTVTDNQVMYGPVEFDEQTFFDYRFNNALIQLKHRLVAEGVIVITEGDLENKFKKLQETVYNDEKYTLKEFTRQVRDAYIEDAYAALVAINTKAAKIDIK